jgi:uracil-DNA glycosylase family 4
MVVGSAPTALDELHGRPFQDDRSRMVFELMALCGLHAGNTWLTHGIKFRLPGNRLARPIEKRAFRPLLQREWFAVGEPPLIITIGNTALDLILGYSAGSTVQLGTVLEKNRIRVWPMLHPGVGLDHPDIRDEIEGHWLTLNDWIKHGR